MTVPDAFTLGVAIARALDASGVPNALGGALALAAWGVPRATVDVDINVFVEDDGLGRVFETLESLGIDVDREMATRDHRSRGMFVVRSDEGIRIDVFTPSIEFSWEAAKTATRHTVLGSEVSVLSAEALSVFKLLFFRSKDIADLERLIATQGDRLDTAYVRHWIADMMGEDDPRVRKWDELAQLYG